MAPFTAACYMKDGNSKAVVSNVYIDLGISFSRILLFIGGQSYKTQNTINMILQYF